MTFTRLRYLLSRVIRHFVVASLFVTLVGAFAWLLLSEPNYATRRRSVPCPDLIGFQQSRARSQANHTTSVRGIDCAAIFRGEPTEISRASQFQWCTRADVTTDVQYKQLTQDCEVYKESRGYTGYEITEEELKFPIAFSILMHEHLEQVEALLRAVYRHHNVYCVHVDGKAPSELYRTMASIANCLDNVFVVENPVSVRWAEFTVLEAEFKCLEKLWQHPVKWKYFINLTGREFPIRTNWELVQVLQAYGGANDIDGTPHRRPIQWTQYVWRREYWRTNQLKADPPGNWVIAKGSTHIAASRAFIGYALFNQTARDLLNWMKDVRAPDEHFFQTLNHNPHMGVPGSYKGDPDLKWFHTRLKIWQDDKGVETCGGEWVRFICNLGVPDLQRIPTDKHMFVNKFRMELDPVAFQCMEQWYKNRTKHKQHPDFDLEFYKQLKIVKNHV